MSELLPILLFGVFGFTVGGIGLYYAFKPWADDIDKRRKILRDKQSRRTRDE